MPLEGPLGETSNVPDRCEDGLDALALVFHKGLENGQPSMLVRSLRDTGSMDGGQTCVWDVSLRNVPQIHHFRFCGGFHRDSGWL